MTRPGARLRALAQRICSAAAMDRLIDPAIADLRHECHEADRQGRVWRGRWMLVVGYIAFWKLLVIVGVTCALHERTSTDDRSVFRTLIFSVASVIALTVLFAWPPIRTFSRLGSGHMTELVLCLVPQSFAIALPLGLVFGVLLGLRNRIATARVKGTIAVLGILCTMAAFVVVGWLMPVANQTFREIAFRETSAAHDISRRPSRVPLSRGYNELTLGELASGDLRRIGRTIGVDQTLLAFEFQRRLALAFAPLALSLLSLGMAATRRRARGPIVVGLMALTIATGYYVVLAYAPRVMLSVPAPPLIAGWTPNLVCFAAALLLLWRGRSKPDTTDARVS
jgi:lipopolysaccharide export LptBFGC system permease protein LptF